MKKFKMRAQGVQENFKTGEQEALKTGEQERTGEPLDAGFKTGEQEALKTGEQEAGMQTGAEIDTVTGNPEVVLPPDSETDEPLPYLGDDEETSQTGPTSPTGETGERGESLPSVEELVREAFEKGRKAGKEESRRQAETDCAAAYLRGRNEAIENKIRRENKVQLSNDTGTDTGADNEPGIEAIFKFRSHVW